ncbi:hypothetical protein BDR03DRAFT_1019144 [Suillus americanus]|nr:hypothetical protein BDR03DRAFT_1019144 [Suillus americanus]
MSQNTSSTLTQQYRSTVVLSYTNNLGTDPEHPVHRSDPDPSSVSVVRSTDPL